MLSFVIIVCYSNFVNFVNQKCSNVDILVPVNPLVTKVTADVMNVTSVFLENKKKNFHPNANEELRRHSLITILDL